MAIAAISLAVMAQSPVTMRWEMGMNNPEEGNYTSRFIIKNTSKAALADGWQIFFNQFSRKLILPADSPVDIEEVSTTYYRITPNSAYKPLAPGDSLIVNMTMRGTMVNICYAPAGAHIVMDGNLSKPVPVELTIAPLDKPGQWVTRADYPDGNHVYAHNEAINNIGDAYTGNDYDIFPMPKHVDVSAGYTRIGSVVSIKAGPIWKRDTRRARRYLVEGLRERSIYSASGQATTIWLKVSRKLNSNPEFYTLDVRDGDITITGASERGVINGVTTLLAAIDHSKDRNLQNAHLADYPDMPYRGFMLDIARNFTRYDDLKRFVGLLAYYKINRLQFHFTDDEAWRLEIPGLPELTQVASRRGCTLDESDFLAQIFDGNGNPNDLSQSANGYITRADFIDLLRFAADRGVMIIPEIETPGHARAAIVAMKARQNRLRAAHPQQADEYVLWDAQNTSQYTSAQSYHDNVLNVASEGTYRFIDKVVSELEAMYRAAGLRLHIVHLGGDEVATGAWTQSPAVAALMQRENLKDEHAVSEYYIDRVSQMLFKRGIRIEGWQEVALNHSDAFNAQLAPRIAGVNAWQTVGKRDEVAHIIANAGYPVILSNAPNFYIDFGYNWHQYEKGLHWGGAVDEFATWNALPHNVYASARTAYDGTPIDVTTAAAGKAALTKPANIIGVQGQLWAETLRSFDQLQYYVLPKMLGLVERGWNADPEWSADLSNVAMYDSARHQYNLKIGTQELPMLHRRGWNFRLAQPGIMVVDGKLLANAPYPGVTVRYTLDGTEPTMNSAVWEAPVAIPADTQLVKARAFYLGKESVTTYLFLKRIK